MKSLGEVSKVLAERAAKRRYGKMQLAADAGVTYRTLSHVLSGEQDFKVSTLMAVADRLGLELVPTCIQPGSRTPLPLASSSRD
jgi:DNA-binding phage protein